MQVNGTLRSHAKDVAFTGLFIALIAVSAWITVPIGPVPVTMQMFSITLAVCVLRPTVAISAIYGYELLGALGVPVFSAMRGGIGVLLGPTGGFLVGYLLGVPVACGLLYLARRGGFVSVQAMKDPLAAKAGAFARAKQAVRDTGAYMLAGIAFTAIAYVFGVLWFMQMSNVGLEVALGSCVIPFIVPDLVKVALAACMANALAPLTQTQAIGARA